MNTTFHGNKILQASTWSSDGFRVVLAVSTHGGYVTWLQDLDGYTVSGNYFRDFNKALADFRKRVKNFGGISLQ